MARAQNNLDFIPETLIEDTPSYWRLESFLGFIYISLTIGAIALIVEFSPAERATTFFSTVGMIAVWRYSWMMTHFARAWVFLKHRFPTMRYDADAAAARQKVEHVYAIVMSYKVDPVEFHAVYDALIKNALEYGQPTTIVASVTSHRDRHLMKQIWEENGSPQTIEIVTQFQLGDGKRSAMAMALRVISRRAPSLNSVTVFMDGDIILEPGALGRTIPFFISQPEIGAITTNNDSVVAGDHITREWYTLRYAQRHVLMASMALSRRLLVLTGRYSIFRTAYATDPDFIAMLDDDKISHWRFGTFKFVSGDDKSTWYYCMQRRVKMLYVPDVKAYGLEELPDRDRFFLSSKGLMIRWFGNMMRTSGRAIALGPATCGFFTWWALVDQRLSMWTSLVGPILAIMFAIVISPIYLLFYLVWIAVTRLLFSLVFGASYRRFSFLWPFLLYYNQFYGSLLKIYMSFRLNKQGWNRQKVAGRKQVNGLEVFSSITLHATALLAFAFLMSVISGQFTVPSGTDLALTYQTMTWPRAVGGL